MGPCNCNFRCPADHERCADVDLQWLFKSIFMKIRDEFGQSVYNCRVSYIKWAIFLHDHEEAKGYVTSGEIVHSQNVALTTKISCLSRYTTRCRLHPYRWRYNTCPLAINRQLIGFGRESTISSRGLIILRPQRGIRDSTGSTAAQPCSGSLF